MRNFLERIRKIVREEVQSILSENSTSLKGENGNELRVARKQYRPGRSDDGLMVRINNEVVFLDEQKTQELVSSIKKLMNKRRY